MIFNTILYVFPDNLPAIFDVWVLGDQLLKDAFYTFQDMNSRANTYRKKPFLYQYFNVFGFYTSILYDRNNPLARLMNTLTEALNRRNPLPRYIIVIPDTAFIQAIKFDNLPGITLQLERMVKWYNTQITRELASREEALKKSRPGAVDDRIRPIIIWVELFEKPLQPAYIRFNRNKFNKGINEMAMENDSCVKVMEITTLRPTDFDFHGNLTDTGKTHLWHEVDQQMKEYHIGENKLLPRHYIATNTFIGKSLWEIEGARGYNTGFNMEQEQPRQANEGSHPNNHGNFHRWHNNRRRHRPRGSAARRNLFQDFQKSDKH